MLHGVPLPSLSRTDGDCNQTCILLPRKAMEKPDPALLERRYAEFRSLAYASDQPIM